MPRQQEHISSHFNDTIDSGYGSQHNRAHSDHPNLASPARSQNNAPLEDLKIPSLLLGKHGMGAVF